MTRTAAPHTSVQPTWFRQVLGQYPTGVSVVTGIAPGGEPVGFAVGTFTSVSLDPPLVGFLPGKTSTSWPKIETAGKFCINVLSEDQEQVCRAFASKEPDKFRGLRWHPAGSGSPVIDGVVAWIDCDIETVHEAGDHYIVIGRVRELDANSDRLPLVFFQGGYGRFAARSLASSDASLGRELRLVDVARPEMENLARDLGARCVAIALVGDSVVVMASAGEPAKDSVDFIGQRTPAVPPSASLFMAYAEPESVERWLAHIDAPEQRDNWRRRLHEVRMRGYSVGLHSPLHADYERLLWTDDDSPSGGPLPPEYKRLVELLPYDPLGFSLDQASDVRSLHAPVFGQDGQVALALSVFLGSRRKRDRAEVERGVALLLEAAECVTEGSGGRWMGRESQG